MEFKLILDYILSFSEINQFYLGGFISHPWMSYEEARNMICINHNFIHWEELMYLILISVFNRCTKECTNAKKGKESRIVGFPWPVIISGDYSLKKAPSEQS